MAVILASLPLRFPGLRFLLVGGARDLPGLTLRGLGVQADAEPLPAGSSGADTDSSSRERIALASLHLVGAADKVVPPQSSRQLAARFLDPVIIEHEQGHCIP
jgi:hypothetical protein